MKPSSGAKPPQASYISRKLEALKWNGNPNISDNFEQRLSVRAAVGSLLSYQLDVELSTSPEYSVRGGRTRYLRSSKLAEQIDGGSLEAPVPGIRTVMNNRSKA